MINGEGLVGKVAAVVSDGAQVDLITDSSMGVSARIGTSTATGLLQPKVGEPNDLLLQYLPATAQAQPRRIRRHLRAPSANDESLYPPGLLIGQVTSVNEESAYKSVNVHPIANLHDLDIVQVLTAGAGTRAREPQPASPPACRRGTGATTIDRRTARLHAGGRMNGAAPRLAAAAAGGVRRARRVLPDRRRLRGARVRRQRRPLAAAGRVRRAAVRIDGRRRLRLRGRPARRPRAAADARADLADLHADRLLVRHGCASCATRRRRSRRCSSARRPRRSRWSATR